MSQPVDTVKSFIANVFDANGVNVDRIDDHFSPDCVFHDAQPGMEGVEGYKALMRMFAASTETVSGAEQPIVIGDGDLVSVRWINQIRHTGEFMGVPPTNRVVTAKGHETYRVENGKIVENWAIMDVAGIMAQLTA